jgi:hypothetical protein
MPGWDGQSERLDLVRTEAFELVPEWTADQLAREGIAGERWWTPEELVRPPRPRSAGGADRHRSVDGYRRSVTLRGTEALPGFALVEKGLADLARGVESEAALLVSIGAPRLRRRGIPVAAALDSPEHRLYELLRNEDPDGAHSRYNALIRRLVSFERAAECAS